MFLHMTVLTIGSLVETGGLVRILSAGGSVERARAPRVSMTRLTQSIWTALSGDDLRMTDPKKTMNMATTLTASWNCKNFRTLSYTALPY